MIKYRYTRGTVFSVIVAVNEQGRATVVAYDGPVNTRKKTKKLLFKEAIESALSQWETEKCLC